MAKGIQKVKYNSGQVYSGMSVPNSRLVIKPDQWVYFEVEWESGATVADKQQPVTWFRQSTDRVDMLHSETLPAGKMYGFRIPRMLCGSYYYYIDASLTGVPSASPKGLFVRGHCTPKIVTSKWSTTVDGEDVRKSHQFSYGDPINLSLETEGINGDRISIDVFRRVKGGKGAADDQHIIRYTNAIVIDGEINVTFGNTYKWLGNIKKPNDVDEFYVKVKYTNGNYISDGKDTIHATYLRIKNKTSSTREQPSTNNTAVKIGSTNKTAERMSFAAVYFRPLDSWNGEFGFDWLREKDNGLAPTNDPAYEDIIEGGYLDGITDLTGGPSGTAYAKLKNQYERLPVANTGYAVTEYFVPSLTLFSEAFVATLASTLPVKPRTYAELKVYVAIKDVIDRLEFEYDKNLLTVDKNILSDKAKTNSLVPSADTSIKITCKKDLTSDKEIKIYCYPTNGQPRILAGKIIVLRNDAAVRRKKDFVLVGVRTNTDGVSDTTGSFGQLEINNLYNSLHQALIIPNIAKTTLDLSTNADFQTGGIHIETLTSGNNVIAFYNKNNNNFSNALLYPNTLSLFLHDAGSSGNLKNIAYNNYFTLFKFGINSNAINVLGAVEEIGVHNVIMFALPSGGDDCTLNHETLHGLGLCHTHRNHRPIPTKWKDYKYIFPCAIINEPYQLSPNNRDSTDNVMSYRSVTRSTWRWQWNIINSKISEK